MPKKVDRFVAPVVEIPETAANGVSPVADSNPAAAAAQSSPADKAWRRFRIPAWVLLLIVAAAASVLVYQGPSLRKSMSGQPRSLAVLPFQNLRANSETEFLGFSLADAVITKLGYVSELSVRPSYAVQGYKAQPIDLRRVASDLNVDTLLTGTILREGDDLRITCQLIDVKTENILWKGGFDLKYEKLLTVQDTVANQIIKGLALTLSPSEAAQLKRGETISPLAYEYYLRGIDLYSTSDFPVAIKMLEKSIELAPDHALTWAHLGKAYTAGDCFLSIRRGGSISKGAECF